MMKFAMKGRLQNFKCVSELASDFPGFYDARLAADSKRQKQFWQCRGLLGRNVLLFRPMELIGTDYEF